jgi:NAD(P)-dependent dehydrogenase (short-subunit alcohol dehydrogenase family)
MNLELADQVAVVVGAASGIGRSVAAEFAREGARVYALDRNACDEATDQAAGRVHGRVVDALDGDRLRQIAREIVQRHQRCDHVVVAIGASSGKYGFPFWNLQPSDWEMVLRVNLLGVVNVAHAFVPHMLPARRGTLCFLASVAGQIGSQTDPPYSAAKAAVINFTQCAAKDLAPYGIRVNALSPGMVKTPLNRSVWEAWRQASPENVLSYDQWAEEKIARVAPLGRWQTPDECAAAVVFLASSRAASITGQTINVDGGQVMHA